MSDYSDFLKPIKVPIEVRLHEEKMDLSEKSLRNVTKVTKKKGRVTKILKAFLLMEQGRYDRVLKEKGIVLKGAKGSIVCERGCETLWIEKDGTGAVVHGKEGNKWPGETIANIILMPGKGSRKNGNLFDIQTGNMVNGNEGFKNPYGDRYRRMGGKK